MNRIFCGRRGSAWAFACGAALTFAAVQPVRGQESESESEDLQTALADDIGQMTLEQLTEVSVMSIAGVEDPWLSTPAAMHVITPEDIRRTGLRSLPELLRTVPGVFVGRSGSHRWSISPRGFNGLLANKTLVLIDGRRAYDPLQGGTFWDVQDVLLEDVERIEVIRGPGPTLWGANAVNGVINVITKSSKDTQGLFLEGGYGTDRSFGSVRYGGQISENAWYSVWGKYFNREALDAAGEGLEPSDDWDFGHGRFRMDIEGDDDLKSMIEFDAYTSFRHNELLDVPIPSLAAATELRFFENRVSGGHVLGKVERIGADKQGWSLLAYYDYTDRREQDFKVARDSFEIELRGFLNLGESHQLATGLEYYFTSDRTSASEILAVDPSSRDLNTISAFVQDTITLKPDRLFAMIGSKFEYNDQTGFEIQPSGRLWFTLDDRQTIWAAVSRPVRLPSRAELDSVITLFFADPGIFTGMPTGRITPFLFTGDDDLDSEKVLSYEIGYRSQLNDRLTLDLAAFYNEYDDLVSIPPAIVGGSFNNDGEAETYGGEAALTWRVADNWRLTGSYSFVNVQVHGPVLPNDEGNTPHHQAQLRSYLDVTDDLEFNCALYYVDEVPTPGINDYLRLDLGMRWHVNENFDLSIWGQNLLEPHREFSSSEIEPSVYIQAAFRF